MNCFVIMPFAPEFDDVYAVIKSTVESASSDAAGRCFRLDDSRPAGRITDRLLAELRSATICVADLTNLKPNVMWEVGYAMALSKPTILLTQDISHLPFDIKDMQSIPYDRNRLSATLVMPLKRSLLDTLGQLTVENDAVPRSSSADQDAMGTLLAEMSQVKEMVSEAVQGWKLQDMSGPSTERDLRRLSGGWYDEDSGSYVYARVIRGELVAPYCYGGDHQLTGVYFGWRKVRDFWFARYQWTSRGVAGFTFLREDSIDKLSGAWWSSEEEVVGKDTPPKSSGVPSNWQRRKTSKAPRWVTDFLSDCEREGLAAVLAKNGPRA
jgi:Nucleoside 2-deoxyribosyltransferase